MERIGDNVEITSKTKHINSLNVTGTKEPVGCGSSAVVGMKNTAGLFSQAGQSGMSEEEIGFGAVVK